jgi:hypothetical protein
MFVRKKVVKGGDYYQLVESRRVDGQPRQKVLLHLGRYETVEAALKGWSKDIKRLRRQARRERERLRQDVPERREPFPFERDMLKKAENAERKAASLANKLERLRGIVAQRSGEVPEGEA